MNQQKLVSLTIHLQRLNAAIDNEKLGPELESLELYVDNENLKSPTDGALLLKWVLGSAAKSVGMRLPEPSILLTQPPDRGPVRVWVDVDSSKNPGIEFIDIMIQGMNRKLDGFPPGFIGDENDEVEVVEL